MTELVVGIALTGVTAGILGIVYGSSALPAAAAFGLLATAIQLGALALVKPALDGPWSTLLKRWGMGMGLRVLGVVLIAVAVVADRTLFPPLPTAFGYLGVIVPLLFMETRYLK